MPTIMPTNTYHAYLEQPFLLFRIIVKEDISADSFEIYGWQVQFPVLQMTNLKVATLYSFIGMKSHFLFENFLFF